MTTQNERRAGMLYRIRWHAGRTGNTGAGTGRWAYEEAVRIAEQLGERENNKELDITFTVEEIPDNDHTTRARD